jgi:hypothetical protein
MIVRRYTVSVARLKNNAIIKKRNAKSKVVTYITAPNAPRPIGVRF